MRQFLMLLFFSALLSGSVVGVLLLYPSGTPIIQTYTYIITNGKNRMCLANVTNVTPNNSGIVLQLTDGVMILPVHKFIVASLGAMPIDEGKQLCATILHIATNSTETLS